MLQSQQALRQQTGADEQDRRERKLRGGEAVAQPRTGPVDERVACFRTALRSGFALHATPARGRRAGRSRPSDRARTGGPSTSMLDLRDRQQVRRQQRVDRPHAQTPAARPDDAAERSRAPGFRRASVGAAVPGSRRARCGWPSRVAATPPRASSRLATLAQAISSTQPTAREQHEQRGAKLRVDDRVVEGHQPDAPVLHLRDTAG